MENLPSLSPCKASKWSELNFKAFQVFQQIEAYLFFADISLLFGAGNDAFYQNISPFHKGLSDIPLQMLLPFLLFLTNKVNNKILFSQNCENKNHYLNLLFSSFDYLSMNRFEISRFHSERAPLSATHTKR